MSLRQPIWRLFSKRKDRQRDFDIISWNAIFSAALLNLSEALKKKDLSSLRELLDAQGMIYVRTILKTPGYPKAEKTFVLDHYRDGDNAPLTAGERKTLTLVSALVNTTEQAYVCGWINGKYSAKATLGSFVRR